MKWMIVTDSSCDLLSLEGQNEDLGFETVPFVMDVDGREFVDVPGMNTAEMVDAMEKAEKSHSACPSPEAWKEQFEKAERVIAFTISGRLSGSFNSANAGRNMVLEEHPEKKIEIIDSLSTGPKLVMLAQSAARQIQEQIPLETISASCRELARSIRTVFTLSSFHNLVQNGRVSKFAGFIAGKLGIRVIGVGSEEGEIQLKELVRGEKGTLKHILRDMEENGYQGTPMTVCHCMNESMAQTLKEMICARWQEAKVQLLPTRGLDSYYAERSGLIICYDR